MSKCPIEQVDAIEMPFEKWAESTGEKIISEIEKKNKSKSFFKDIKFFYSKKFSFIVDTKRGKAGVARCSPHDTFNAAIGATIAFYRLMDWELPACYKPVRKKVEDLKRGDMMYDFTENSGRIKKLAFDFIAYDRAYIIVYDVFERRHRSIRPKDGAVFDVLEEEKYD